MSTCRVLFKLNLGVGSHCENVRVICITVVKVVV